MARYGRSQAFKPLVGNTIARDLFLSPAPAIKVSYLVVGGGGAGSGGGSINLLYGSITNAGVTLQANGGTGGTAYNSATGNGDSYKGKAGDGGAGSIRYNSLRVS